MNNRFLVMSIGVLCFVGGAFLSPSRTEAAPQNPFKGRLIKSPEQTAVYFVAEDGKRHAFPNEKIFFTWYKDFLSVEVVSSVELASFPLGKNVLYRPGSRLIKIPSVREVYAVEPWGVLRNLPSEDVAIALYGDDWSKFVDDIDVSFFFDYTIGGIVDVLDGVPVFPVGTVVNSVSDNFIVDKRTDGVITLRSVSGLAWDLNEFNSVKRHFFVSGSIPPIYSRGLPIMTAEAQYSCISCDPKRYERKSIATTLQGEGGQLRIEAPRGWDVNFLEQNVDSELPAVLISLEADTEPGDLFAENLFVLRWEAIDFNQDVFELLSVSETLGKDVYYKGNSAFFDEGYDMVFTLDNEAINWSHLIEEGDYFYQLQFTALLSNLEQYVDVIDLFFSTFSTNQGPFV